MASLARKCMVGCISAGFLFATFGQQVDISGTVKDGDGNTLRGVLVSLIKAHLSDTTDAGGRYHLSGSVAVRSSGKPVAAARGPAFIGTRFSFSVTAPDARVRLDVLTISGKRLRTIVDRNLPRGHYEIAPRFDGMSSQVYFLKLQVGAAGSLIKMPLVNSARFAPATILRTTEGDDHTSTAARAIARTDYTADTVIAGAVGYTTVTAAVSDLNGTYDLTLQKNVPRGSAEVIQTSKDGDRATTKPALVFADDDGSSVPAITVDTSAKFQTIIGFGGAFTESATYCLSQIGAEKRNEILNQCFNPYTGSGYTMSRTHINSCDFCLSSYSYDDSAGDKELKYFSIAHEKQWMIPAIKEAQTIPGAQVKLFASPWSPPGWMKTSGSMIGTGNLKTDCYDAWALYFSKYIKAYEAEGIKLWAITTQNEPLIAINYEACLWTPEAMRDFIKNNLGPRLEKDGIQVKVMAYDYNKEALLKWADTIYGDSAAAKYLWGFAYHWYSGDFFPQQDSIHDLRPDKHLLMSEACWWEFDKTVGDGGYEMWENASRFGHSLIGDLNNWGEGWVEWNLVLNQIGGPTYCYAKKGSIMTSSIITDLAKMTVHYNPSFYYLRQFSKYVRPGAVRIGCASAGSTLEAAAFVNTNGTVVVEVLNDPIDQTVTVAPVSFKIKLGNRTIMATIPGRALTTFVF